MEARVMVTGPVASFIIGWLLLGVSTVTLPKGRKIALRIGALRRFERGTGLRLAQWVVRTRILPEPAIHSRARLIGWQAHYASPINITPDAALKTSVLLKEPGPNGEKGVLYSSFEYNWMKVLAGRNPRAFFRNYILVGASSWSPGDFAVLASLCGQSADPAFIGISNCSDIAQYRTFAPAVYALPMMACDWCDPDFFHPRPHGQRSIDIVMVAHFARWKRHWLLFEALRKMPKHLNVVLIGRESPGRTQRKIRAEARAFGVPQELTVLSALESHEVAAHQCDAKLSVILSKREGSCVAVTEAMFADSPVAMMRDAHIGARAHINAQTGRISGRRGLSRALMEMLENPDAYSPRAWACANISAQQSSAKLNAILREHFLRSGRPWTRDLAPLCWRYVPRYLHAEDAARLAPGVERLRERHGIELEEFVSEAEALRRQAYASEHPEEPSAPPPQIASRAGSASAN